MSLWCWETGHWPTTTTVMEGPLSLGGARLWCATQSTTPFSSSDTPETDSRHAFFKYLLVKENFYTPGLQLLIFSIHLPRRYPNFLFYLLCCYPADGECGWDAGMERMCWHLRTAFTYRILPWCLVCHRWSFRYDTLTFVSFQHLQVQTEAFT